MERLTTPIRDLRQRPGAPSPAGSAATEDEGQRFLEDMSASEMSDKNPAGRLPVFRTPRRTSPTPQAALVGIVRRGVRKTRPCQRSSTTTPR